MRIGIRWMGFLFLSTTLKSKSYDLTHTTSDW